jgi:NAD(P)-dependent dehydrogenase (short-subunit alcohol dehydrogenase family)
MFGWLDVLFNNAGVSGMGMGFEDIGSSSGRTSSAST